MLRPTERVIVTTSAIIILLLFLRWVTNDSSTAGKTYDLLDAELMTISVDTAVGSRSLYEINEQVYKKMGYQISQATIPIPTLQFVFEQTCEQIFNDYISIAEGAVLLDKPPAVLDDYDKRQFTLFGHSVYSEKYFDEATNPSSVTWSTIDKYIFNPEGMYHPYQLSAMSLKNAMEKYPLTSQRGLVVGSKTAWVEIFAFRAGAEEVITLDYKQVYIVGTQRNIKYMHPVTFAQSYSGGVTFDFAVSFGTIEHSGLQRYGDPSDPIGDIREMLKIRCVLKSGGLLYLGIPRGQDRVVFNAYRVYGRIRLPMLFTGFKLLDVFRFDDPQPRNLTINDFMHMAEQLRPSYDLYVLQKL